MERTSCAAAANGTDEVQDAQAEVLDVGRDGTADQNWTQATATAQQNESDAESSAYQTLTQNTATLDAAFQNYEANSDAQTIAGLDQSTPWGKLANAKAAPQVGYAQTMAGAQTTLNNTLAADEEQFEVSQDAADALFANDDELAALSDQTTAAATDLSNAQADAATIAAEAAAGSYWIDMPTMPTSPLASYQAHVNGVRPYDYSAPGMRFTTADALNDAPGGYFGWGWWGVYGWGWASDPSPGSNGGYWGGWYGNGWGWGWGWGWNNGGDAAGGIVPYHSTDGLTRPADAATESSDVAGNSQGLANGASSWDVMQNLSGTGAATWALSAPGNTTVNLATAAFGLPTSVGNLAQFQPATVLEAGGPSAVVTPVVYSGDSADSVDANAEAVTQTLADASQAALGGSTDASGVSSDGSASAALSVPSIQVDSSTEILAQVAASNNTVKFGALNVTLSAEQKAIYDNAQSQLASMGYATNSVQYELRSNIVLAALTSSLDFPAASQRDRRPGGYWFEGPKYFQVKPRISPSMAVLDAWARGNQELWNQEHPNVGFPVGQNYLSGCKMDCQLIFLMGISLTCYQQDVQAGHTIGPNPLNVRFPTATYLGKFDNLIGSRAPAELFDAQPSKLQIEKTNNSGFALSDLTPGDRVWVENPTPTGANGDEGTNLIYAGNGVFISYNGHVIPRCDGDGGLYNLYKYVQGNHGLASTAGLKIVHIYQPRFPF